LPLVPFARPAEPHHHRRERTVLARPPRQRGVTGGQKHQFVQVSARETKRLSFVQSNTRCLCASPRRGRAGAASSPGTVPAGRRCRSASRPPRPLVRHAAGSCYARAYPFAMCFMRLPTHVMASNERFGKPPEEAGRAGTRCAWRRHFSQSLPVAGVWFEARLRLPPALRAMPWLGRSPIVDRAAWGKRAWRCQPPARTGRP